MTQRKLLLPLLACFTLFAFYGCRGTTTTDGLNYGDFDRIYDYDEVFDRHEGTYLVYVYSMTCENCAELKPTILSFADRYDDRTIYFFNADNAASSLQAAYLAAIGKAQVSTPVLLLITANGFDKTATSRFYFAGIGSITSILTDLENGAYPYWE